MGLVVLFHISFVSLGTGSESLILEPKARGSGIQDYRLDVATRSVVSQSTLVNLLLCARP